MFGFGKKKMEIVWNEIAIKLRNVTPFQRYANDGKFPDSLKNNNYVLGYHFMLALNLYIIEVRGKTSPEEQGFILANSLSITLEIDAHALAERLESLMANPDTEFIKGTDDANSAFEMLEQNNDLAFAKFLNTIRDIC